MPFMMRLTIALLHKIHVSLLCLDLLSFSRVVSKNAADATPGVPFRQFLSVLSLATILSPEPTNIDFSEGAEGVRKQTTPNLWWAWFEVTTATVP